MGTDVASLRPRNSSAFRVRRVIAGEELAAGEGIGFQLVITTDRKIPFQQNLTLKKISSMVLCEPTTLPTCGRLFPRRLKRSVRSAR